jgi:hypothetical protein
MAASEKSRFRTRFCTAIFVIVILIIVLGEGLHAISFIMFPLQCTQWRLSDARTVYFHSQTRSTQSRSIAGTVVLVAFLLLVTRSYQC